MAEIPEAIVARPGALDESNMMRSVLRLAWPVVIQQVSFSRVQLVDTALVGHLGEDALAGVRLGGLFFWFAQAGMTGIGVGATAIIARTVGAGEAQAGSKTLRAAIFMAALWGLAMGVAMWFLSGWSMGLLGAEPGARQEGTTYLKAIAVGMPFWSVLFAGTASLQGAGDTKAPMVIAVIANIGNAIIAYVLINGPGPAPRLEVAGSGAGFTSAGIIGVALGWGCWHRAGASSAGLPGNPPGSTRRTRGGSSMWAPLRAWRWPSSTSRLFYTRIIASLGTASLAAHGVTIGIQSLRSRWGSP